MKKVHRGYTVKAEKEESMGGWRMIYYSILDPSGDEIESNFTEEEITLSELIQQLCDEIDSAI